MGSKTVYAARMQFAVMKPAKLATIIGPTDMSFKTQRTKPRRVADARYRRVCSFDDLIGVLRNYEVRYAQAPDVLRVHPAMKQLIEQEARDRANRCLVQPARKGLTFCGVKVTL